MHAITRLAVASICSVAISGVSLAAPAPRDPALVRQTFQEIASRLDQGGDLFVVANVDGLLEEWMGFLMELTKLAPVAPGSEQAAPADVVAKLSGFLKKNGFYAVNGLGMSVVPRADGHNDIKSFISRDAEAALLPLWRGLVGVSPSAMGCLAYLSKDTVLARSGTADLQYLWQMAKTGITEMGGPEAVQGFNQSMEAAKAQLGTSVDSLMASLGAEGVVSIQLSSTATSSIPMGATMVDIPQPSLLVITAVKDSTIIDTIKRVCATMLQMPLPEMKVEDATLYTIPLPVPFPVPVQITLATHGPYLILGSSMDAVSQAIRTCKAGDGLRTQPEFRSFVPESDKENNGIVFVSSRFGKTIADVQARAMAAMPMPPDQSKGAVEFMRKMMTEQFASSGGFTIMNYRGGIKVSGTSTAGGRQLIAGMALAPIGMLSAIAIPSFVKARTVSQENACINNLRQLDAAKEQWALEANKSAGDAADEAAVLQYVKGAAMPVCPQGGVYQLNAIGESPTCSHPGHALE